MFDFILRWGIFTKFQSRGTPPYHKTLEVITFLFLLMLHSTEIDHLNLRPRKKTEKKASQLSSVLSLAHDIKSLWLLTSIVNKEELSLDQSTYEYYFLNL